MRAESLLFLDGYDTYFKAYDFFVCACSDTRKKQKRAEVAIEIVTSALLCYHNAILPAIPKSIVAVATPSALNTLLIVGIVIL